MIKRQIIACFSIFLDINIDILFKKSSIYDFIKNIAMTITKCEDFPLQCSIFEIIYRLYINDDKNKYKTKIDQIINCINNIEVIL